MPHFVFLQTLISIFFPTPESKAANVVQLFDGLFKVLGSWELQDFDLRFVGGVDSELQKLRSKLKMVGFLLSLAEEIQLKKDDETSFCIFRFNVQKVSKTEEKKVISRGKSSCASRNKVHMIQLSKVFMSNFI